MWDTERKAVKKSNTKQERTLLNHKLILFGETNINKSEWELDTYLWK